MFLPFSRLSVGLVWGISLSFIGATLLVLGFLLLRPSAKEGEKRRRILDVLMFAGLLAIGAGELLRSWPLLFGGLALMASPISPQIAETARRAWNYLAKSYREISQQ